MATAATPKGKAVLIGATGAIGCCLFGELLRCKEHFEKVVVFGRSRKAVVPDGYGVTVEEEEASGRLIQHIQDFDELPESTIRELCAGSSVFFSCMGSTRKQAGSAQAFYHIDFELNMKFATAAKAEEVPHFSLVSSSSASPTSWIHYFKTKGQLDEAVKALNFKCLTILRPGLLDRGQERRRFMEKVYMIISSGLPVATVAQAMLYDAIAVLSAATVRDPSLIVANNALIHQWASEGTKPKAEATSPAAAETTESTAAETAESTPAATETTESTPAATETTESTPATAETTESTPAAAETTESTPPAATETTESTPAAAETTESTPAATETTESTPAATETTESTPAAAETTESTPAAAETTESTPAAAETTESTPAAAETTESTPAAAETTESTPAAAETTESTPAAAETTESSPAAAETTESTTAEETKSEEISTESAERADGESATADEVEGIGEETAEREEKEEEQTGGEEQKEEDKASTENEETKEE